MASAGDFRSLNSLAASLRKDLKRALRENGPGHPSVVDVRRNIRDTYERAIFADYAASVASDCERHLWRTHHVVIDAFRAELREGKGAPVRGKGKDETKRRMAGFAQLLDEASAFYTRLIGRFEEHFSLELHGDEAPIAAVALRIADAHARVTATVTEGRESDAYTRPPTASEDDLHLEAYLSVARCHVCLGDIARYRELHGVAGGAGKGGGAYATAREHYRRANRIAPHDGTAHNQLAVVSMLLGDGLGVAYHYAMSLSFAHVFEATPENARVCMEKSREARNAVPQGPVDGLDAAARRKRAVALFLGAAGDLFADEAPARPDAVSNDTLGSVGEFDALRFAVIAVFLEWRAHMKGSPAWSHTAQFAFSLLYVLCSLGLGWRDTGAKHPPFVAAIRVLCDWLALHRDRVLSVGVFGAADEASAATRPLIDFVNTLCDAPEWRALSRAAAAATPSERYRSFLRATQEDVELWGFAPLRALQQRTVYRACAEDSPDVQMGHRLSAIVSCAIALAQPLPSPWQSECLVRVAIDASSARFEAGPFASTEVAARESASDEMARDEEEMMFLPADAMVLEGGAHGQGESTGDEAQAPPLASSPPSSLFASSFFSGGALPPAHAPTVRSGTTPAPVSAPVPRQWSAFEGADIFSQHATARRPSPAVQQGDNGKGSPPNAQVDAANGHYADVPADVGADARHGVPPVYPPYYPGSGWSGVGGYDPYVGWSTDTSGTLGARPPGLSMGGAPVWSTPSPVYPLGHYGVSIGQSAHWGLPPVAPPSAYGNAPATHNPFVQQR